MLAAVSLQLPIPDPQQIVGFALILTRVGATLSLTPVISGKTIPLKLKAIIAIALTLFTLPLVPVPAELAAVPLPELFILMLREAVIGLAIGLALGAIVAAWSLGGAVIDIITGFSYGGVIDPQYGNQSSILQQLYVLLAGVIFITVGGEQWLVSATVGSFQKLPLGATINPADFLELALAVITTVFITGLGVIAPLLIALLVTDAAFGLIARAAPQTQVMQLEFPVKIAVALFLLVATLPWMVPYFVRSSTNLLGLIF